MGGAWEVALVPLDDGGGADRGSTKGTLANAEDPGGRDGGRGRMGKQQKIVVGTCIATGSEYGKPTRV